MRLFPKGKLTWLVVLFLVYVYYKEYFADRKNSGNVVAPVVGVINGAANNTAQVPAKQENKEKSNKLSDQLIDTLKKSETAKVVIDALAKKAIEDKFGKGDAVELAARKTGSLVIVDVIKGTGQELRCGAEAVVNYDAYLSNGMKFDSTKAKDNQQKSTPITLKTGKNEVLRGLEAGIVGMREGGRRKIAIPPELAFNNLAGLNNSIIQKDEIISYDVELIKINDGPYKNGFAAEVLNESSGSGNKVLCGDKVRVKYNFIKADGYLLDNGYGETEFLVGAGNMPMGLEFTTLGMTQGSKKTAQIPYQLLKIVEKPALSPELKFNQDEPVKLDLEVIEVK